LKFNPINQIHKFRQLPPSLLCLLISKQVFKIGSAIKGDITCLKHQFPQLAATSFFNIIDLKEYCINCGIITHREPGSLHSLCEKTIQKYLPKDDILQKNEEWERTELSSELVQYACLDVFACHLIFERVTETRPPEQPSTDSPLALGLHC
jgi:ribonuclease D